MVQSELGAEMLSYAKVLADGEEVTTLDFAEQLSLLLFLKMADEYERLSSQRVLPIGAGWSDIVGLEADLLEKKYVELLGVLAAVNGPVGAFFLQSSNRIRQPALLHRVITDLVGTFDWTSLEANVKGPAFEQLVVKGIETGGSKAGKHFTPRTVISAIVEVMNPGPADTLSDPTCGTGGFLIESHRHILDSNRVLDPDQRRHLRLDALTGVDIAQRYQRLATMNLLLHGVGTMADLPAITQADSLAAHPGRYYSMVLANPVFGSQSSLDSDLDEIESERVDLGSYRDDFWTTTPNKQLNFVQHIKTILAINGRAAVVLPDNVLFEAGAGEVIRRALLAECDVHTILRMPQGVFLTPGTKVNVVFFDRKPASESPWTQETWIYDLRTNKHFTLKQRPLTREDLDDFVACYQAVDRSKRVESERFKRYTYDEIMASDKVNLDIAWLKDDSETDTASLTDPDVLIAEIVEELNAAANELAQAASGRDVPLHTGD
jgi:type I restriction enzyme M protein